MEKYIITDTCYIMNNKDYENICSLYDVWVEVGKKIGIPINTSKLDPFEAVKCPFESTHRENQNKIIFHHIESTPHGDGGYTWYGQEIAVDAGMLCIAECEKGWKDENLGATFETLEEAKNHFPSILKRF